MTRLILLLSAALAVRAEQFQLTLNPAATTAEWTVGTTLHTVEGAFRLKRGTVNFDTATGKASGEIIIDAGSGESGNGSRDGRMHKVILESAKYPEIVFTPDRLDGSLNLQGASEVSLHGSMMIHGAAHELTMKVAALIDRQQVKAFTTFAVPYTKWGMKDASNFLLKVKESVAITIHCEGALHASPPKN